MKEACIYTVANKSSQEEFANLIYSVRASGCGLDIVLIPFGGKPIDDESLLSQVKLFSVESFPRQGIDFIAELGSLLECPHGYLRRFLSFFGPYQRFIYTDNDIVALANWEYFIEQLDSFDLVHADMEYTTLGKYNFKDSSVLECHFGNHAHEAAITAGHFAARKSDLFIESFFQGLAWMADHSDTCNLHDQTLMQVASLCGNWKCLNLCKPPHNWLSSWAGDYKNSLDIIHSIQRSGHISHLHYSGGPIGAFEQPIDELLLSCLPPRQRLLKQLFCGIQSLSGLNLFYNLFRRFKRMLKHWRLSLK
jgi:hypothetical protein